MAHATRDKFVMKTLAFDIINSRSKIVQIETTNMIMRGAREDHLNITNGSNQDVRKILLEYH